MGASSAGPAPSSRARFAACDVQCQGFSGDVQGEGFTDLLHQLAGLEMQYSTRANRDQTARFTTTSYRRAVQLSADSTKPEMSPERGPTTHPPRRDPRSEDYHMWHCSPWTSFHDLHKAYTGCCPASPPSGRRARPARMQGGDRRLFTLGLAAGWKCRHGRGRQLGCRQTRLGLGMAAGRKERGGQGRAGESVIPR